MVEDLAWAATMARETVPVMADCPVMVRVLPAQGRVETAVKIEY
jgi:hypothetical protein